jgi:uncharacterized membrane protein YfcA
VTIGTMVIIGLMAVIMEMVDSGLGMMYGTLLSPLLILMGYNPKLVVPSILISQATGDITGATGHHLRGNADFGGWTKAMKISMAIIVPGLLACVAGVYCGKLIPVMWMKTYIGILVIAMGFLCLFPIYYTFSWKNMYIIGLLSGFNKAFSGGGFGPVTSTGKILGGVDPKMSISTTTLAEGPVCILGFILWWFLGGSLQWQLPTTLCAGALIGGYLGPIITQKFKNMKLLRWIVGALAIISGVWLLVDLLLGLKMGQ